MLIAHAHMLGKSAAAAIGGELRSLAIQATLVLERRLCSRARARTQLETNSAEGKRVRTRARREKFWTAHKRGRASDPVLLLVGPTTLAVPSGTGRPVVKCVASPLGDSSGERRVD